MNDLVKLPANVTEYVSALVELFGLELPQSAWMGDLASKDALTRTRVRVLERWCAQGDGDEREAPRELFSVVVHYTRGTYIGQYKADGARDAVLRWTRSAYAVKTWGAKAFDIEAVGTPVPRAAGAWMIRGKGRATGRPARIVVVRTAAHLPAAAKWAAMRAAERARP